MTKKKDPSELKIHVSGSNVPIICKGPCGRSLEVNEANFYFRKSSKNGKMYPNKMCRECEKNKSAASRKARWSDPHERQIIAHQNKKWQKSHPEYLDRKKSAYRIKYATDPVYRAKLRKTARLWGKKNPIQKAHNNAIWHQRTKRRSYKKRALFATFYPDLKLRDILRSAINEMIRSNGGNKNGRSILQHLPYTMHELRAHLESLWEPWMNWSNYGPSSSEVRTWQIDHIISQADLPYDDFSHLNFLKCWSLSNLRPLESSRNASEGRRVV